LPVGQNESLVIGGSKSQEVGRYKNRLAINASTTKIITHKYLL
jgi:hypothetical protein